MNHTIQLTAEQFQALQSGHPITIEPPKQIIQKWEPKGGYWCVEPANKNLAVQMSVQYQNYAKVGLEYENEKDAVKAAKALRSYARQLAWLAENDDGWIADWSDEDQPKYKIAMDYNYNRIRMISNYTDRSLEATYMSKQNAEKLVKLMNDGIVEF